MLLKDFVAEHGIQVAEARRVAANPYNPEWKGADHWILFLSAEGGGDPFPAYFSCGYGHKGEVPGIIDVMECLRIDAQCLTLSFEEWATDFGFDHDSRKAEATFNSCVQLAKRLEAWLGPEAFEALLTAEND